MPVNIGTIDRVLRLLIGIAALASIFVVPFALGSWPSILAGMVGVIMIVTSAIKFCPLYRIFGLRTCKV